jgi:tRNA modification GTPase
LTVWRRLPCSAAGSPQAGTTRDALGATVRLARGLIHVVDVAGVEVDTNSEVERKMHATALRSIETADVVVLVRDVTDDRPSLELMRAPQLIAVSKTDLRPRPSGTCCVSAVTGEGMDELRQRLDELCFGPAAMAISAGLALTARHVRSIESAIESLNRAMNPTGPEIVALELREALDALGSILGQVTPDAVLDHVFATFCIGK